MTYVEKEKLIKADIASIENRVRHAFNQGYDLGFKKGRESAKSLEQEPCEDCVSREAVLDILKNKWNMYSDANDAMQESIDAIEALPPVTPQPKSPYNEKGNEVDELTLNHCITIHFQWNKKEE